MLIWIYGLTRPVQRLESGGDSHTKKKTHFLPEKAVSAMQKSISGKNAATAASRITRSAAATLELVFSPFWSGYTKKLLQVWLVTKKEARAPQRRGNYWNEILKKNNNLILTRRYTQWHFLPFWSCFAGEFGIIKKKQLLNKKKKKKSKCICFSFQALINISISVRWHGSQVR